MPAIVRVLWGDDREYSRQPDIMESFVKPQLAGRKHCPQWIYVYGKDNADYLTRAKIKEFNVVLVDPDPYPDGKALWFQEYPIGLHQEPHPGIEGKEPRYLIHPWHNKSRLLLEALKDHGEVIYCDWDVIIDIDDPREAFDVLGDRQMTFSILYYAVYYKFFQERDTEYERRSVSCGNWIHMKGSEFVQAVLDRLLSGKVPGWDDQLAMRAEIEDRYGGWPDEVTWLREFESPIMGQRAYRTPWKFISHDGDIMRRNTPIPFEWNCMFRNCGRLELGRMFGKKRRK